LSERQLKLRAAQTGKLAQAVSAKIKAPMPGKIIRILVNPGDEVQEGQGLLIMEAMKMENELRASRKGIVQDLRAEIGQSVESGALLMIIE
jgi:biotin carboxyl carrier protein